MTPEDHEPTDPGTHADAAGEETVRRLLAASGGPVTMPPEVAARLDDVLADLQAERSAAPARPASRPAPIADLDARRARRWPKVLVAAAAVSVLGVGLGNVMDDLGVGVGSPTSDQAASESAGRAEMGPAEASGGGEASSDEDEVDTGDALAQTRNKRSLPKVRSESVTADASRILAFSEVFAADRPQALSGRAGGSCEPPALGRGDGMVAVRLDGEPATLVFRAREGGRRQVEVFACDDPRSPVLVTTVDAR